MHEHEPNSIIHALACIHVPILSCYFLCSSCLSNGDVGKHTIGCPEKELCRLLNGSGIAHGESFQTGDPCVTWYVRWWPGVVVGVECVHVHTCMHV